ncbi:lipopolysaccharide heptosyltransferase II [Anatilimnocola sp. NA78]|uniref:lipopolysaccharide heptosyltransferase II n=1 Tax=Anatilimnocola sp. NA78 TaxID=3415683 RepID=UPI003CE5424A
MRIGVILPNWVGDVVMATPTLRALRQTHPAAEVVGIGRPFLKSLLGGTNFLDSYLGWEHHGKGSWGRSWQLVRTLRAQRLDAMLVLRNSPYAAAIAYCSGAKQRIGFARRGSGLFLTKTIQPPRENGKLVPISAVDYYAQTAEALGCSVTKRQLELATLPADEAAADLQWKRLDLPSPEQVVLLNTGGAFGSTKHWPARHSVNLARRAATDLGLTVLVLCGPNEREEAADIASLAAHPLVKSVAGEDVSFGVTKALVRRARMLITTDSGPRHIASAMQTPTITLFGPIDPRWSRNYQDLSTELHLRLDCAPCGKKVCPLSHHACMQDLHPDLVLRALKNMLERTESNPATSKQKVA